MTREEYILYRNNGSGEPLYEYYKENYKGSNMLKSGDFFQAMQMWPNANEAFGRVLKEYDIKFTVVSVQDLKTGQILRYL